MTTKTEGVGELPPAASELAAKALKDNTSYQAREVGEATCHDVEEQLKKCAELHRDIILEDEFCLVRVIAKDNLIKNLTRIKYYAWPYLPSPRPNQAVFLYNRILDKIVKRLWVLPNAFTMAELATKHVVPKEYETMQAWSIAFYEGGFWEYVRYEHGIDMLSESEYLSEHREELIKAGCKESLVKITQPFDFSKIQIKNFVDPSQVMTRKLLV